MAYRGIRGSDPFASKTTRNERFAQMSKQEQLIEQKKREIQAKLEEQKKKETEEALKKLQGSTSSKSGTGNKTNSQAANQNKGGRKPFWKSHDKWKRDPPSSEEGKKNQGSMNIFSNDGSFLDQFKKLSGVKETKLKKEEESTAASTSNEVLAEAKDTAGKKDESDTDWGTWGGEKQMTDDKLESDTVKKAEEKKEDLQNSDQLGTSHWYQKEQTGPGVAWQDTSRPSSPYSPSRATADSVQALVTAPPPPPPPPPPPSPYITYSAPPPPLHSIPPPSPLQPHSIPPPSPLQPHSIPTPPIPSSASMIQQPPPPTVQLTPTMQQPPPVIQAPPPTLSQLPPPTTVTLIPQVSSGVQAPPPIIQQPPPIVQAPPPVIQAPAAAIQQTTTVIQQPNPTILAAAPAIQQPPPVIQQTNAALQQPPPTIQATVTTVQQPPPVIQAGPPLLQHQLLHTTAVIQTAPLPPPTLVTSLPGLPPVNICTAAPGTGVSPAVPAVVGVPVQPSSDSGVPPMNESTNHLARMVAQCGDDIEQIILVRNPDDSNLWFLRDKESPAYIEYRKLVEKFRLEIKNEENKEKDGDDHDNKAELKQKLEENRRHEADDDNSRQSEASSKRSGDESDEAHSGATKRRKRRSRWAPESEKVNLPIPVVQMPAISNTTPMLSKVSRSDPALLQYAIQAFGTANLSEEDWKKAEDHYKINLLYQDMLRKRQELERLQRAGKFKYEYDSDEETEGGTWEHRLRQQEMEATQRWAEELTKKAEGKHHIGDFLPPDELERFLEKYNALKEGREPDLSDYKEYKLKEDNIGFQMLQKLGWQEGQGLGSDGSGIVDPVNKASSRPENQGLGVERPDDVAHGDDEYDAYRKRMMLAYRFRPNPLNNPRRPYY